MKYSGLCLGGPLDGIKLENDKPFYETVAGGGREIAEVLTGRYELPTTGIAPTPVKTVAYLFRETSEKTGVWVFSDDTPYNSMCKLHKHYNSRPVPVPINQSRTLVKEFLKDNFPLVTVDTDSFLSELTDKLILSLAEHDLTIAQVKK